VSIVIRKDVLMRGLTDQEPATRRRRRQSYPDDAVHISRFPELWDELRHPVSDRSGRGIVVARQGSWFRVLIGGGRRAA